MCFQEADVNVSLYIMVIFGGLQWNTGFNATAALKTVWHCALTITLLHNSLATERLFTVFATTEEE